jgi:prepilin-type N-terminal cleavage/methylation domain-containing protein
MTENTSTTPTSAAPTNPEEESVTDYLLRKISSKQSKTTPAVETKEPVSLSKPDTVTSVAEPAETGGFNLIEVVIVIGIIGLLTIGGVHAFSVMSGAS